MTTSTEQTTKLREEYKQWLIKSQENGKKDMSDADWWLNKIDSIPEEKRSEIEKLKKDIEIEIPDTLHRNTGYNQAIDDVISILSE